MKLESLEVLGICFIYTWSIIKARGHVQSDLQYIISGTYEFINILLDFFFHRSENKRQRKELSNHFPCFIYIVHVMRHRLNLYL